MIYDTHSLDFRVVFRCLRYKIANNACALLTKQLKMWILQQKIIRQ